MGAAEPIYHRNRNWFSFSEMEKEALCEPALAHVCKTDVFMTLDIMPELLSSDDEWIVAQMRISVRCSPRGLLFSRAALGWMHLKFSALCVLCHEVDHGHRLSDYGFCSWLVGRSYHGADPICSWCNGKLHQFSQSLSINQRRENLRNEAEYVSALREITKSSTFRSRVRANAGRLLRVDPRREPMEAPA